MSKEASGEAEFFQNSAKDTYLLYIFYGQDTSFHFKQILTQLCLETFSKLLASRNYQPSYFME